MFQVRLLIVSQLYLPKMPYLAIHQIFKLMILINLKDHYYCQDELNLVNLMIRPLLDHCKIINQINQIMNPHYSFQYVVKHHKHVLIVVLKNILY